ncbi:medium-chain acyl-CoA ligase ACSF2, mitochondrial-like [Diabrotica virgifera virgifera]|uniref:Medium-chain acyl-CoA ligase ACSF2, mitochondrial n=1 Tax=Diabrotica virgifera virgifera TaxID=50390 RepID=A0ABM5K283_DIAVI|nr:medium-chain acyl-CoA ligase ACSF2, mitochondrial-like [Diabrotica virgifera virgifera]
MTMRFVLNRTFTSAIRHYHKLSYVHNVGEEPLRPLTLGRLLERTSAEFGQTPAVTACHQDKTITFKELLHEADRLAAGLRRLGFKKGDKVGLWAPNIVEWYTTFMACARGGYLLVSINPYYQKKELEYAINKVGVNVLICPISFGKQQFYDIINLACPELPNSDPGKLNSPTVPTLRSVVLLEENKLRGTHTYSDILNMANAENISFIQNNQKSIKIDDPCYVMFTSGTTGLPKAPVLSHFSAVNNAYFIGKRNHLGKKQHTLCIPSPLFHAMGSVIGLVGALSYGTSVVLPSDKYDPRKNIEALKKHKCTIMYATPTMHIDLINLQKEKKEKLYLETVITGGAICTPTLFREIKDLLGVETVKSIYGLTETTGSTFQSLDGDTEDKITKTVGYLQEHLEIKIVDSEGIIVPRGVPGELCIRGYSVMTGYYGDIEKTNEAKESTGWFHTGDLFILDEDGYGEIVGRLKDMIIRGGENIYPRELEDFLNTHPDIIETQVIGLPHDRLGEEICACIRTKYDKQLTLKDLHEFCFGTIASFKIPTVVKVMTEFPKTLSGKVQKRKLIQMFK